MATIEDQILIDEVTADISVPCDNTIQTYRFTAAQMKAYILSAGSVELAALDDDILTGLTEVTPTELDFFSLADTSDSNKTKKGAVSYLKRAAYRSVTTTDAVTAADETMKLSGASFTSTLPTAVGIAGKKYKYLHAGTSLTQLYTLATTSAQTIGGIASGTYKLCTNGEVLEIESDGANWIIVGRVTDTAWIDGGTLSSLIDATTTAPVIGSATIVVDKVRYRRVGDSIEAVYDHHHSAAGTSTAGTGDYLFKLPGSLSFNATLLTAYTTVTGALMANSSVGLGFASINTYHSPANCVYYDATRFRATRSDTGASTYIHASSFPFNTAALYYNFHIKAPISGWQP